jgi:hypothetical protein
MRRDFQLAIILAIAAIPAGTALMAAPEYLHLTGNALAATFWGGAILTALLIVLALAIALRGEAQAPQRGHPQRMAAILGMAFCGAGFVAFAILFFVQRPPTSEVAEAGRPIENRWTWPPLTSSESDILFEKLRGRGQYSVHVACNRAECAELAGSFDKLFKRLGWPSFIGDGGILAAGVTGVLINPDDQGAKILKAAIETSTVIRADLGPPRTKDITSPIMLVIGTKPEILAAKPMQASLAPDVAIRFVYPKAPALLLVNQSDQIARQIKWSAAIWNIDDPRTYANPNAGPNNHDPLPISVQTFDFLRPKATGGPQTLFDERLIKPGQRLFGTVSVVCPDCQRGRTYFVHITWGEGGWYTEIADRTEGELVIPHHFTKELVQKYYTESLALIPDNVRNAIPEANN